MEHRAYSDQSRSNGLPHAAGSLSAITSVLGRPKPILPPRCARRRFLTFFKFDSELLERLVLENVSDAGDAFAHAPISQLIGLQIEPGQPGEAVVRLDVGQKMHNPMGVVHGGVIALLADAAMGIAFGRTLSDSSSFATIEMKVSYLRPVRQSLLTATAISVARGLRVGFVECVITDSRGKEIARASCTCTVNSLA